MSCNNRGCGHVGGASTGGCWTTSAGGCGNVGGANERRCGCGNVGGAEDRRCGDVGGAEDRDRRRHKCCICYLVEPITNCLKCLCGGCRGRR